MQNAIGMIELNSVAKGFETADTMIKTSDIEIIEAHSVCPGKFIILVTGLTAEVQSAMESGEKMAEEALIDKLLIPNISDQLIPALRGLTEVTELDALGIIETFSAASCILAADAAVKKADIELVDIRIANALGGKAYVTMTGEVGAVRSSVSAGCDTIKEEGILVRRVVIPQPHKDLTRSVI